MSWNGRLSQKLYLLAFNAEPSVWLTTVPHGQNLQGTSLIHSGIAGILPSVPLIKICASDRWKSGCVILPWLCKMAKPTELQAACTLASKTRESLICLPICHPNDLRITFDLSEPKRLVAWRLSHLLHQHFEVYWCKIRWSEVHETLSWPQMLCG